MPEQAEWLGAIDPPTDEISELRFSLRSMAAALAEMSTEVNAQAQRQHKQDQHIAHLETWVHQLLNPEGAQP